MDEKLKDSQHYNKSFDLKILLSIVKKHWIVILTFLLLFSLLSLYFSLKAKPVYQSSASLIIERPNAGMSLDELFGMAGTSWEFYPNQIHLLQSMPVAKRVVEKVGLENFVNKEHQLKWYEKILGMNSSNIPPNLSEKEQFQKALANVRGSLSISQEKGSGIFIISFDDYSPKLATLKANALSESYIDEVLDASFKAKQRAGQSLSGQLPELERKVKESEDKLKEFQKNNQILAPDEEDGILVQELSAINNRISELRRSKLTLESVNNRIVAVNRDPLQLSRIPDLLEKPEVQAIKQRYVVAQNRVSELGQVYGPKHPKMKQALEAEKIAKNEYYSILTTSADLLVNDFQTINREISLESSELNNLKSKLSSNNESIFEYETLKRDYEYNQQIYSAFLKQLKETDAVKSNSVQSINARIVNPAIIPASPYKPNKKLILLIGVFVGLVVGFGVALLIEYFDNTFKSSNEVESKLNLPVIGMLPEVALNEEDVSPAMQFSLDPKSIFSESIRTLRTGVLLSMVDEKSKSILVTSTVPSEGKTTISLNLANALSQLGETILVEADLRRPMIKKSMGEENKIGLSTLIAGESSFSECMKNTIKNNNLHILSSGPPPPNPLELLSSDKFDLLLRKLKEKYKYVVVDCAPVMAVSDALTLSQKVDGVLFTLRYDSTPSQMVENAVKRLNRAGARIIGVALNRLKSSRAKYGKYYNYENNYYGHYGYHQTEDDSSKKSA